MTPAAAKANTFLGILLPAWMKPEDVYLGIAVLVAAGFILTLTGFGSESRNSARIRVIQERRAELRGEFTGPKRRKRPEASVNFMRALVTRLHLIKKSQIGKTEARLVEAGFRSKDAIFVFTFFNMLLPILLGALGFIVMKLNGNVQAKFSILNMSWPVAGAYIGMKLPGMFVGRVRKKRFYQIQKSLADVLDLMTICAEAGLSMPASLDRVSRELTISYPEMAEELKLTSIEIGFLPDRNKALTNLAERVTMPEVRGIVSVLIQTEKYGTPIATALRVLAAEFRQARMLRAEQKAARLPALMTLPMIVFILPTLFIVIIAPAIIRLSATMGAHPITIGGH